jgi:rSAM/selenodomain-associated transferase 1
VRILIATKAPRPGRSKTRLLPTLSPVDAARLHEALLLDTLDGARREGALVALLVAEAADVPVLEALVGDVEIVLQDGAGLADALFHAFAPATAHAPVAVISSDTPGVPPGEITAAAASLAAGVDVALGPTLDGGYWLIAMAAQHAAPFRDIPWSTDACLAATLDRCREASLDVHLAVPWRDIDVPDDVAWLRTEVNPQLAPRTASLLPALGLRTPPSPHRAGG